MLIHVQTVESVTLTIISCKTLSFSPLLQTDCLGESFSKQVINQLPCNGRYSSSNPIKVAILATEWRWWWSLCGSVSSLAREFFKQLAKFPQMKVSVLVPEGSCDEYDKREAKRFNVTIVEAENQPGLKDPVDCLYLPPKGLTTDIVIGADDRLCKRAQIFKELHHCKSIFLVMIHLKEASLEIAN